MTETRRRHRSGVLAGALAAIVVLTTASAAMAQIRQGTAEVKRIAGRVEVLAGPQAQWIPATTGTRVAAGGEIRTAGGASAELELPDTSSVLVAENSRLQISKLVSDPQGQNRLTMLHLPVGKVRAVVATAAVTLVRARQSNFVISTPTGVAAARGTEVITFYNPATRTTITAVLSGSVIFSDNATRTPVTVTVNSVVVQTGNAPPAAPVSISVAPPAVRAQSAPTTTNTTTANQPALTAPPTINVPAAVLAVIVAAIARAAPQEAATAVGAIAAAAPEAAATVTAAAVAAAPNQAAAITTQAVTNAPGQAASIAAAAVTAAPTQAAAITNAAITAAPTQATAIQTTVASAAVTPPQPVAAPVVVPVAVIPATTIPVSNVGRDQTVGQQQQCASPPCPGAPLGLPPGPPAGVPPGPPTGVPPGQ